MQNSGGTAIAIQLSCPELAQVFRNNSTVINKRVSQNDSSKLLMGYESNEEILGPYPNFNNQHEI